MADLYNYPTANCSKLCGETSLEHQSRDSQLMPTRCEEFVNIAIYLFITVLAGMADAYGFSEASHIWGASSWSAAALARSGAGYAVGIVLYWLSLRFITASGVLSATVQTLTWFVITMIGVAVLSGDFKEWDVGSYVLAVIAVAAVAGLLIRA